MSRFRQHPQTGSDLAGRNGRGGRGPGPAEEEKRSRRNDRRLLSRMRAGTAGISPGTIADGRLNRRIFLEHVQQPVDERHELADLPLHHGRDGVEELRLLAYLSQQLDSRAQRRQRVA